MPRTKPEFRSLIEAQSLHSLFSYKASAHCSYTKSLNAAHPPTREIFTPSLDDSPLGLEHHEETKEALKSTHLQRRHEPVARLCDAGIATLPECITSSADRPEGLVQLIQFRAEAFEDMEPSNHFDTVSGVGFSTIAAPITTFSTWTNRIVATSESRRPYPALRYLG